jgi:hypothetical protein
MYDNIAKIGRGSSERGTEERAEVAIYHNNEKPGSARGYQYFEEEAWKRQYL